MIINHPILGPRDEQEFVYLCAAELMARPDGMGTGAGAFCDWLYTCENAAGEHGELWYHEQGDRSWLVVTRNTVTHEISRVELARDVARAMGLTGRTIPAAGTTVYRPPYTPVALGALAGRSRGKEFKPTRLTPSHKWAQEQGAVFVEVGNWLRTQWIPRPGETTWRESVDREVLATRKSVGNCDVTTLGKIDVQGTDAGAFLDRVYSNTFSTLPVGKCRNGLMLREDGMVFDDGTTARMAEHEYVMTTTMANAITVFRHLEYCRQALWPDMDVQLISTTEAWAQFSVAGPNARKLLARIVDQDISDAAFPYMACGAVTIGGLRARLFRISFSGELAYEIAVPTRFGDGRDAGGKGACGGE